MKNNRSLINTKSIDITKPGQFADLVLQAKEIQNQLDAFWGVVDHQMLDHNITSIKGDWGSVSRAERANWKADETLPPRFFKKVADTDKIKAYFKLNGKAPRGASLTMTQYLSKRIKAIN